MTSRLPTVIVTGASGFVGSALIEKLAGKFDLVGFDRESSPHPPVAAECVCIDVTSDESVAMALERGHVAHDTITHRRPVPGSSQATEPVDRG